MIKYSARAAKALGYLKRRYNDIEVYVEDTSSPNMWIRLLESLLPLGTQLKSVNLLNGRKGVLDACRIDQGDDGRKKLYIIDGDFDFLHNRAKPRLKFLHRLPSYCVENLLSHELIVQDAAFTCCTRTTTREIVDKIKNVLGDKENLVRTLFAIYATSEKLKTGVRTVKYGVHRLLSNVGGQDVLDETKLKSRIVEITRAAIRVAGALQFSRLRKVLLARAQTLPLEKVVSGKDFLFPLVWGRLNEIKDFSSRLDHFKVHLAKSFNRAMDPTLARTILKMAS
ncbi:DUF4435 domain-containing protein [Ensifer adhaerens]|uniref:DUF4435 domain-containing protein n=1 Tax=Ensifer adhaerens TaxID=106592 RepID=UPI0021016F2E|nr:DUF4435 domain-containing protein [Ensifer adhaerens]UTV37664.1 DUF4435 domain-containing protein [Ensifer adhaerens]